MSIPFVVEEVVTWDTTLIYPDNIRVLFKIWLNDILALATVILIILEPTGRIVLIIVVLVIFVFEIRLAWLIVPM
jgi:hypothetical protein